MARTSWLAGSTIVFALTAMTANAQAGPVGATAKELMAAGQTGAILQEVAKPCLLEREWYSPMQIAQ